MKLFRLFIAIFLSALINDVVYGMEDRRVKPIVSKSLVQSPQHCTIDSPVKQPSKRRALKETTVLFPHLKAPYLLAGAYSGIDPNRVYYYELLTHWYARELRRVSDNSDDLEHVVTLENGTKHSWPVDVLLIYNVSQLRPGSECFASYSDLWKTRWTTVSFYDLKDHFHEWHKMKIQKQPDAAVRKLTRKEIDCLLTCELAYDWWE